jgi:Cu-Zn family superoxide dismutase
MLHRFTILAAAFALAACATTERPSRGTAALQPSSGTNTNGVVNFVQVGPKVVVSGEVRELKPNAVHGFHVHEKGDCSAADATSAGGHFNPDAKPHGEIGHAPHHAGDLMVLKADAQGVATFSYETDTLSVGTGSANDVIGRGVVVHRDPDDFKSQPAGNSGARIACGAVART